MSAFGVDLNFNRKPRSGPGSRKSSGGLLALGLGRVARPKAWAARQAVGPRWYIIIIIGDLASEKPHAQEHTRPMGLGRKKLK